MARKRNYASTVTPGPVTQLEQADPRQVKNSAGGFTFKVSNLDRVRRFIILGSDKGSYYIGSKKLTIDNFNCVKESITTFESGKAVVDMIVDISHNGLAPKNDGAIFALAVCAVFGDEQTRAYAYNEMPKVCRIGTHLFQFVDAVVTLKKGKKSKGIQRAISRWYNHKAAKSVAFQVCKYPQRGGENMSQSFSHRDLLRISRPGQNRSDSSLKTASDNHNTIFKYVVKGKDQVENWESLRDNAELQYLWAHESAKAATSGEQIVSLINQYGITRESIPNNLFDKKVWKALLNQDGGMPLTAMIRNAGAMTAADVLKPLSDELGVFCDALTSDEGLQKARIHPMNLLIAQRAYNSGHGASRDKSGEYRVSWSPVAKVTAAFEKAFYKAFKYVEPSGKKFLLGVDVSGSMGSDVGLGISCAEAAAVVAMTVSRTEPKSYIHGFAGTFVNLRINDSMFLSEILNKTRNMNFGSTDCSLPMTYAYDHKLDVDTFVVLTDNETWAGRIHPHEALDKYRKRFNKDAKLVVVGFVANEFTVGDPNDPGTLNIAGLDSSVPKLITDFSAGKI